MERKYEIDMTRGAILPKLIVFTVPLILTSILQLLFNALDLIVCGRFVGPNALAAVGSTTSLINLLIQIFVGVSVGANIKAARLYGEGDLEGLKNTVSTSVIAAFFSGILVLFIGLVFSRRVLIFMGSPEGVIDDSSLYLQIYFLGMPFVMLYDYGAALLRAEGDTRRPMYFQLIAGILNFFLNLFFVLVFHLGVAGVGIATTISQTLSGLLVVYVLFTEKGPLRLSLRRGFHKKIFGEMLFLGIPAGIQSSLFSLSNVIIQSSINSFGEIAMAGSTAAQSLAQFVWVSMNAFYQANMSFTSQNIGAGKYSRINRISLLSVLASGLTGLVFGNLVFLFGRCLLLIYSSDPYVIEAGMERLRLVSAPYFLCGIMDTMVGGLRGMGYAFWPMIVSLFGACALRIIYIFTIFKIPEFHSLFWLYMTYPLSWALTFLMHLLTFLVVRRRLPEKDAEAYTVNIS